VSVMSVLQELVQTALRMCHQSSWPVLKPMIAVFRPLSIDIEIRLIHRKSFYFAYGRELSMSNNCRSYVQPTEKHFQHCLTSSTVKKLQICDSSPSFTSHNFSCRESAMPVLDCRSHLEQRVMQLSDKHCLRFYVTDSTKTSCKKPLSSSDKSLNSAEYGCESDVPKLHDSTNQMVCTSTKFRLHICVLFIYLFLDASFLYILVFVVLL